MEHIHNGTIRGLLMTTRESILTILLIVVSTVAAFMGNVIAGIVLGLSVAMLITYSMLFHN